MEILFGTLAKAILGLLIADLAERTKISEWRERLLSGDSPEKLAVERALKSSHTAFSARYAELASSFFDGHLLRQPEVERELAKALTPNRTPDAAVIVERWRVQFPVHFQNRLPAIEESTQFFLTQFQEEVTAQPALQSFVDGRAFQELYEHTELLTDIRDEMRRLNRQGEAAASQSVVTAQTTSQLPSPQRLPSGQAQPGTHLPNPFAGPGTHQRSRPLLWPPAHPARGAAISARRELRFRCR